MSSKTKSPAKKSLVGWIIEFAGEKKGQYITSVFFALLSVACCIAPYFMIARIVQQLLAGVRDWSLFLREAGIVALFWLGNVVFHMISTSMSHIATFNLLGNIRKKMCDKLTRLPLGTVLDMPSGSLKNIMIERIDSMETTLAHIVPEYTSNIILSIILVIYLFVIDWRLALACMAVLPIGFIAMCFMMKDGPARFKYALDKTKALNDTAVEYINGIEVIKAFGKSKSSYERFVVAAQEGSACYVEWMRDCIWPHAVATVVTPSLLLSLLPIGGYLFFKGNVDASTFITMIILAVSAIQPFLIAFTYHDDIAKAGAIFGEVGSIMKLEELDRPAEDKKKPADNSILLKNVHFSYHKGIEGEEKKEILHGVSMSLPQGSYTAFVGPSGSGKSTIARLIASLWDVDSGSVQIGGVNIKDLSLEEYNRRVAYVSQDNFLFDMSVRENIRLGREGATDADVEEVARKSGCYDFIMSLENGFDTIVGGSGAHLSGGERQRIAIARAMMKDAPIVILDEATAYTDPENEAIIQQSVAKLVAGKTLIVIAHRLSTVKDADKLYVIKDGLIDSSGTHEELLAQGGLYKNMWEAHIDAKDE
ncbi:ATP-binding cassette, subfamily B [Treponema bryantii]|uniref:ATP-binding cassette, subfamily B n=1 Tax=Treponema bryantii TaxID=163 RepID=A0A1H9FI94_9SPIR|nr:ABC transporter ATP-binding protein [Treponema bryantii]SEQ37670.1 ATP-binding cassette, subfamily B [Treponema bryantii]